MKTVLRELPALVSEVVRLMHEQEVSAATASFMVVTQNNCWQKYKEILSATNAFLSKSPEFRQMVSPARTEYELPTLPTTVAFKTFLSASADALRKIDEDDSRVIEIPPHRSRLLE